MTTDISRLPAGVASPVTFSTGYSATYLGHVPTESSAGREYIEYCIEKVLDRCNVTESNMADAYVAVRACALLVYFVDADRRVTHTRHFDLARIAECSVASGSHVTTLAWLYREPLNDAFQVVCHVTRFKSEKTARVVAAQVYDAFQRLYTDCQMALASSRLFAKMARQRDLRGGCENAEGFVFDEAD
ncbi:hypothetical protein LSAT2_009315 [Lamellibrachia satsuma]|nr:hypothetical protein LSAT2_009315 [Lamellibrachia satsuma]